MKTKISKAIGMALVVLFLAISEQSYALTFTKEISQEEVQNKLTHKFPINKKKLFLKATFTDPIVSFIGNDNRVGVGMAVKVIIPGTITGSGGVDLDGSLRYENETGSFYLDNIVINKLTINGMSEKNSDKVKKLLQPIAKKALHKIPVYKFKDDIKQQLAKAVLNSVTVKEHLLLVELGVF